MPRERRQAQQERQPLPTQELEGDVNGTSNKTRTNKEIHYSTEMIWGTKSHYFLSKISVDTLKEKTVLTEFHSKGWVDKWRKPSETI